MLQWVVTLRGQARLPQLFAPATHTREHTPSFPAPTSCPAHSSHPLISVQMPQGDMRSPVLSSLPNDSRPSAYSLTPLQSALTENAYVTPLESALPKSLDLKSFRI